MIFQKSKKNQSKKELNLSIHTQKKHIQNSFFFGEKWKEHLKTLKNSPKIFLPNTIEEKKEIISLNEKLKSKLSFFFFKPWIKNKRVLLTSRQKHLKDLYKQYQKNYSLKKRKDFLKTSFGEIFKTSHLHGENWNGLWISARILSKYKHLKEVPWNVVEHSETQYYTLVNSMQKGWLYENLLRRKTPRNAKFFVLDRPHTAFQNYYKQQQREPWVDSLIFKRWAYFGFIERSRKETKKRSLQIKSYLRKWNPRFQKRNKLYWWRQKLLFDFYHNNGIKKDKAQRIKQVLSKIYFPFYGHLQQKQFQAILKKKNKIKSKFLNKNEQTLSALENRLDVVVYRLNLAPNILWARRLILEGSVFVSNMFSFQTWIWMYGQIKHLLFPLKLRDPKNLYKTTYWNPNKRISKFKFLLKPVKKIHYLVQPGDLIQTSKTLSINKLKNNSRLFKKPITKNLYSITKTKFKWSNSVKAPWAFPFKKWRAPRRQITASMFLFDPKFTDLSSNDRAQEFFFRWITL